MFKSKGAMKISTDKLAFITSLYMAISYIAGMFIFIFLLDYPNIEPAGRINLLSEYTSLHYFTNLFLYVIFGFSLVLFSLSLYENFKEGNRLLARTSVVTGIIWAGLLIASGMIANAGIAPTLEFLSQDPEEAKRFWRTIETVSNGLGGAHGEVAGGVFTVMVSLAAWQTVYSNRFLNYFGLITGTLGVASTFPDSNSLTGVFGITQAVWFIWSGTWFLRKSEMRLE
jgi:hypothetical protein